MDKLTKTDTCEAGTREAGTREVDTYKLRVIRVDGQNYGFDDVDLLLVDLKTNMAIGEYNGESEGEDDFTREDFDFY